LEDFSEKKEKKTVFKKMKPEFKPFMRVSTELQDGSTNNVSSYEGLDTVSPNPSKTPPNISTE